jgi:hypothetical protein
MFRPVVVAMIAMCSVCGASAAQDAVDPPLLTARMTAPLIADWAVRDNPTRGPVLPARYVSLIGLQANEGYSTRVTALSFAIRSKMSVTLPYASVARRVTSGATRSLSASLNEGSRLRQADESAVAWRARQSSSEDRLFNLCTLSLRSSVYNLDSH